MVYCHSISPPRSSDSAGSSSGSSSSPSPSPGSSGSSPGSSSSPSPGTSGSSPGSPSKYKYLGKALSYYWQLKAIESAEKCATFGAGHTKEEVTELITTLIDNHRIKDILVKAISVSPSESRAIRAASTPTVK